VVERLEDSWPVIVMEDRGRDFIAKVTENFALFKSVWDNN
jgi:hypothetical protein